MADAAPLAGIRAVERGTGLGASYAGFLLGALGAEVVRVERPGAGLLRRERALARGKRSVILDPSRSPDRARWDALVASADAVVTEDDGGPPVPSSPDAIRCRVSAWGGVSSLPPDEALVGAATGAQAMQWSWDRAPVWLVTPIVGYMTGMLAALGVTAALLARRRGAPGQTVEVSGVGASFALNSGTYVTGRETRGSLSQFGDPRGQIATYSLFRALDGWLFIGALTPAFLVNLMTVLDRVDLLADPRLQAPPLAFGVPEIKELVRRELDPILARRPAAEWVRILRQADIPCGAVRTREDALRDEDARALGLVVPVDDPILGAAWQTSGPAQFSDTPIVAPGPAPLPGADTEAICGAGRAPRRPAPPGPAARPPRTCLDGIRVLDLASFIAGPFCPMLLADLGAEVLKVESPDGDPFRMAAFGFVGWNRGKRSIVLDLKRPEGRDVFLDLVRRADVVVDNFRGGVMDRLGIGWDALRAVNERLVHTSITGYGSSGPLATLPGFDPIFQAGSGLMAAQGGADDPVFHMIAYTDYSAGTLGALATVAALLAREGTGRGQRVDVSLFRTGYVTQAAETTDGEVGGRDHRGPAACRRIYACGDGWICIAASRAEEAAALGRLAGADVGLGDRADGPAAVAIARLLADLSRADALERLANAGVPAAPCRGFQELFTEPSFRESGAMIEQIHPALGALLMPGPFIRFEATPSVLHRSAPLLGADGADVLAELGYSPDRITRLLADGIVGRPA
jgi:crotonobetainyl-CoA:carnitine CoA-transferase CaiB-like acyl-CoA transferase